MHWLTNFLTPSPPVFPCRLFQISGSRGQVVQHSATFKASVRTGGGGGYLDKGTGYIWPVWSRTDHVHYQEFWLRTHDGQESHFWLQGYEAVRVRQGHEVGVLLANDVFAFLMNYSTGTLYRIAPLDRLLPLQAPLGGCGIIAITLLLAPLLGATLWFAGDQLVHLLTHNTFTLGIALLPLCWLAGVLGIGGYLLRRSRRVRARNEALWSQGRAELDTACRRSLNVEPAG